MPAATAGLTKDLTRKKNRSVSGFGGKGVLQVPFFEKMQVLVAFAQKTSLDGHQGIQFLKDW